MSSSKPPLHGLQAVTDLVERFNRNRDTYHSDAYKEAEVRAEFINPFFEALGWDMANMAGAPAAYKEVVHEASLKMGGGTKAPDRSRAPASAGQEENSRCSACSPSPVPSPSAENWPQLTAFRRSAYR